MAVVWSFVSNQFIHPVALWVATGQQRCARGGAGGPGHIKIRQPCAFACQTIQVWGNDPVAQKAQVVVTLVIGDNQQNVGRGRQRLNQSQTKLRLKQAMSCQQRLAGERKSC